MASNLRSTATALLYVSIAALAISAVRMGLQQVEAHGQPVTPLASGRAVVPYTVVLSELMIGKNGRKTAGPNQTWALRSDGAVATKIDEGELGSRVVVLPDGTRIEVSDSKRVKSTTFKPHDRSWVRDPIQYCAPLPHRADPTQPPTSAPPIEMIQGYRAVRVVQDNRTTWFALDVGCATLKREIKFDDGTSTNIQLVSLIPGEPSMALFTAPDDYREGPPSEFAGPPSANCSLSCQESRRKHFERLDAVYHQFHIKK